MPVNNDGKRIGNRPVTPPTVRPEATPASSATSTTPVASGTQPSAFDSVVKGGFIDANLVKNLDALRTAGRHAEIVRTIRGEIASLGKQSFTGLDASALVGVSARLYVFEERLKSTINSLSLVDNKDAKVLALDVARQLAALQTGVFRQAVKLQDAAEAQPVTAVQVFWDTMKKPGRHDVVDRLTYLAQKTVDFYLKGGSDAQIRTVDPDLLRTVKSGQLLEYVVDGYDIARAAVVEPGKPSPGHTVLSQGNDALSAGTFEVQKDASGRITQILVGTFSGHFRTGLDEQKALVRHLVAALQMEAADRGEKLPSGDALAMIIQREGQATHPRTLEVLGRALGADGAEAQRAEEALRGQAMAWRPLETSQAAEPGAHPLSKVLGDFKKELSAALQSRAFLKGGDRATVDKVLGSLDSMREVARDAGATPVLEQLDGILRALLDYVHAAPNRVVDDELVAHMETLQTRWANNAVGTIGADLGTLFSPPPTADRKTRVVATINPKATDAQLRDMVSAGMDVARFNTAHGTTSEQIDVMKKIRAFASEQGRAVSIQVDLEGPKIRLGKFANPNNLEKNDIWLKKGDVVTLTTKDVLGDAKLLPVDYPTLTKDVKVGEPVFMNDGNVILTAQKVDDKNGTIVARVDVGGKVWDRKGINLPQSQLSIRTVTEEDVTNLTALLPHVDLVAMSFVRSAEDVMFLRDRMIDLGRVVPIIAKIERAEAGKADVLTSIAMVSDALMVARGDLGVEVGPTEVPVIERRISEVANQAGIPVMLATEVMMSLLQGSRPTRGDTEGLFSAVFDRGVHAVMLGKETSFPDNPGDVIRTVSQHIESAEAKREATAQTPKADAKPIAVTTARDLMIGRR